MFEKHAKRQLESLDSQVKNRILRFLHERLALLDDPRVLGTQLQGDQYLKNYRFRVGNYRIIARLEKRLLIIAVLEVGHRGDIYR